jgi:hypothetical protein
MLLMRINWGRALDVRVEMGVRKETSGCSTAVSYIEVKGEEDAESFSSTQHG